MGWSLSQCFLFFVFCFKCRTPELESPSCFVKRDTTHDSTTDIINQDFGRWKLRICNIGKPLGKLVEKQEPATRHIGLVEWPPLWWEKNQPQLPWVWGVVTGRMQAGADACPGLPYKNQVEAASSDTKRSSAWTGWEVSHKEVWCLSNQGDPPVLIQQFRCHQPSEWCIFCHDHTNVCIPRSAWSPTFQNILSAPLLQPLGLWFLSTGLWTCLPLKTGSSSSEGITCCCFFFFRAGHMVGTSWTVEGASGELFGGLNMKPTCRKSLSLVQPVWWFLPSWRMQPLSLLC